ncbi:S8 family peptidase [Planotetraspora kaengkrachanensis]|uniref:Serine protease n=1 Tax=Planotetraspora kaengkrachanensis TaxID=575193 RepID=A0A8J3PT88_9ACTN|nr:S8 family peptidase [Planotetraspora kaengkrachanensis]GIG79421.1 serine protease [Planotetraspora kaengkrachanensis]
MLKRTRWALLALTVTATVLNSVPGHPAAAHPAAGAPDGGKTYTVTLLTGDEVTVVTTGSGCPKVTVRPADPSEVVRKSCGPDGHARVVPARVAAQVGSVLDPALFDVTALIHDGYDDARTAELPVIVRPAANARVAALGGVRPLPSIGAVAGHIPKKGGATAKLAGSPLLAGAAKVWLDRKVAATTLGTTTLGTTTLGTAKLDRNLSQVAAPQAWNSGYTGKGTRVAVLDTGADFTHPDLAGRVVDRADFTVDGGDAVDHKGHGTHVAATIAGSGAASHGERRGVAPDARLLVGKVLDDDGFGTDSQIIAGMEWAASRADVVNMSLGGTDPSDGTDPLSLAVDALTEQTGALFVIAAGNTGGAVSSPGAAAGALTVGAVDGADRLADFSSRGPLMNTRAAKPELVAPGVDVVAARAAGTTLGPPVDAHYVSSSGTSMATPHVAGAAALLAQRHPDWKADRLKAALVGAADPLPAADPYAVGSGRLNAARALSGPVSDQPVVALGTFRHPQAGTAETELGWTGDPGPESVTLDLGVTVSDHAGRSGPRGAASLSTNRVRLSRGVPGGATLRIDRSAFAGAPGLYTATVTARTSGGKLVASTPVTFYVEPPSYDLTVNTVDMPDMSPTSSDWVNVLVTNLDDPIVYGGGAFLSPGETATLRVPAGRYAVTGAYSAYDPETSEQWGTFVGDTDVTIAADRTMTLDPAQAKRVTASVDGVTTRTTSADFTYLQTSRNGLTWFDVVSGWGEKATLSVGSLLRPGIGSIRAYTAFSLESPENTAAPYHYDLIRQFGDGVPADPAYRVSRAEQARLARIDQRFSQMDSPGMVTSLRRYGYTPDGWYLTQNRTYDLPVARTDYVSPGFLWQDEGIYGGLLAQEGARSYPPGSRQAKVWARQPLHSDWYDDPAGAEFGCASPPSRTRGNLHVDLVMLTDRHQRADCLAGGTIGVTRKLSLYRDGKLAGEQAASRANFTVPEKAADYRLTLDVETGLVLPISTRVTTSWTFRSAGPSGTGSIPLPLLSVGYALPLDAANHPAGGQAAFDVRQAAGVPAQRITSFQVWSSTDDGATWRPARVNADGAGYRADLPAAAAGQAVSLRVKAAAGGGSGIDQTIIRAYHAG